MSDKRISYKQLGLTAALLTATLVNTGYALAAGGHGPGTTSSLLLGSSAVVTSTVQAKTGQESPISPGDAWLIAERELWLPVVDQLGQHLMTARLDFMNKDNSGAAQEIRQGAEFLQQEEQGPGSPADVEARAVAADGLTKLADQVEQEKITSVDELDKIFAQAYRVDIEHRLVHLTAAELSPLVEKPAMHLRQAAEAFKTKDNTTAAAEIHKALAFLKIEAAASKESAKAVLQAAIDRLEVLAADAAAGNQLAQAELDQAFSRAEHALAYHHRLRAEEAIARDETKEAGYELKAAVYHLEQALTQAGYKIEEVKTFDVKDMNALADKLIAGGQVESKEITQALAQVNQEIERLGGEILVQVNMPWLVIDDHTFIPVVDKMSEHLQLAHQAFVDKDYPKAAQELRQAATFMKEEGTKLTDKAGQAAFQTSVSDLEKRAGEVEQGKLTKLEEFNTALYKAYDTDIAYRRAGISAAESTSLVEWPIVHLGQARAAFERKDTNTAADEIFKAVGFLRLEKSRATGETRTGLENAMTNLEKLARQVREGKVTSTVGLDQAFMRAYQALGQHHYLKATAALDQKNLTEAGYELRAATRYLEQAQTEMKQPAAASHDALRDLADGLIAGKYPGADNAQQSINEIGQELEQLGQAIDKMPAQADTASVAAKQTVTVRLNNNSKEMGYELQAAANHLEQALSRAGSRIEAGNETLVKELRTLADKLIAGEQVEPQHISQVLENMGKKLEALGVELDIIAAAK